jgi:hypothetical protein
MTAPTPTRQLSRTFVLVLCMALALALPSGALAAEEEGTTTAAKPHYTKENRKAFEEQLAKGEIKSAEFNKKLRSLHIKTANGTLYLYHYEKKGAKGVEALLKGKHVSYTVLTPKAAAKEAKEKPAPKHKIRYIVGAVVIVLIIIGGIVWYVRRRRVYAD